MDSNDKPLLGISTCLLGLKVRFDGGHKLDHYLNDLLGQFVDFHKVCPEVECGLPTPREAMRLEDFPDGVKLMSNKTKRDITAQMTDWMAPRLDKLDQLPLCGFIFKAKSPSCGLHRVKVYPPDHPGAPRANGRGIFAEAFARRFPHLPMEEEGRLHDPGLRENFITRVFIVHRWRQMLDSGLTTRKLIDFHSRHKYLFMAHSPVELRELGKLTAHAKTMDPDELKQQYFSTMMTALLKKATFKKNVNVMQHMLGYFKKLLAPDEKKEVLEMIDNYHRKLVPILVPLTLINHYVRKFDEPYLSRQFYLNPHPLELMLRNHV